MTDRWYPVYRSDPPDDDNLKMAGIKFWHGIKTWVLDNSFITFGRLYLSFLSGKINLCCCETRDAKPKFFVGTGSITVSEISPYKVSECSLVGSFRTQFQHKNWFFESYNKTRNKPSNNQNFKRKMYLFCLLEHCTFNVERLDVDLKMFFALSFVYELPSLLYYLLSPPHILQNKYLPIVLEHERLITIF